MCPEALWKQHERRAARMFGAERALQEGREGADFESTWVVGEVKSRKKLPKWLTEAMNKVIVQANEIGKLPVLCLVEKHRNGFLVVIDSRDFEQFFGFICEEEDEIPNPLA